MESDNSELKIAVEEGASWSRRVSITVPADRVRQTRGRIAEQIARTARLPGFRKGRLPTRVIEQRFGPSIDQETIDRLIQETYREALDSAGITPINQGKIDDVKYDPGAELSFEVEVEVRPEIELTNLSGFSASRPSAAVGDEEVDSVIERLRDERADWVPTEEGARPDYGDQALVEITAIDAEGNEEEPRSYRIVIGEDQAIPDVENAILTLSPGQTEEFSVTFPEDFPDEARRGQQQKLRVELQEARRKVLPDVDEEFARAVGDFDSIEALRDRILTDLEADTRQRAESEVRRQLIDQVLSANPFEAPASMRETYLDRMLGGSRSDKEEGERPARTPEEAEQLAEMRERLRPQAEWLLKRMLVIDRLAEQEGLRASQDDIDQRVESIAERHERPPSEVWLQLEKSGQLEVLEREITEEKVFEFLESQSTVA